MIKRYTDRPPTAYEHARQIRAAYRYRDFADRAVREPLVEFLGARAWIHAEGSVARNGRYMTQQVLASPVGPLSFDRGWASIDARLHGHPFRFTTTHLETENFPSTQQAQATEFLAGPGRGGTVIAVGDFNSAADARQQPPTDN